MEYITFESSPVGADLEIEGEPCGQTPAEIELTLDQTEFYEECIINGSVSCEWGVLETWLERGVVGQVWWDLTDEERYSIVDTAVRGWTNTLNYPQIQGVRSGGYDCSGGTEEWRIAQCLPNAIIRYATFGERVSTVSSCYYTKTNRMSEAENCYCGHHYHLPVFIAGCITPAGAEHGFGHAMAAVQIKPAIDDLSSYYIFQYNDYNIQLRSMHIPIHSYDELYLKINDPTLQLLCTGYRSTTIVSWKFINGELI